MSLDVIGLIPDQTVIYEDDLTATTYLPGWHVNTVEPVPEWEQYRCHPEAFYRVYAGGVEPVCYRFPDQGTFEGLLPKEEPEL